MVAFLLTRGAKVNQADGSGKTAIYQLLEGNHSDSINQGAVLTIARDLLKAGADPNISPTTGGGTPLMLAAQKDMRPVFRLLLENGADPKAVDGKGRTVIMHAISKDNADAVDQLLARGVSVNARDQEGSDIVRLYQRASEQPANAAHYRGVAKCRRYRITDGSNWLDLPNADSGRALTEQPTTGCGHPRHAG